MQREVGTLVKAVQKSSRKKRAAGIEARRSLLLIPTRAFLHMERVDLRIDGVSAVGV